MEILASSGVQLHRGMKKREKVFAMSSALDDPILQLALRCEPRRKKQKARKRKEEEVDTVAPILEPVEIVENHEAASDGESHEKRRRRKKKMMEMEEVAAVSSVMDDPILQLAERCGPRRKKQKRRKIEEEEGTDVAQALQPVAIVESHEAAGGGEPHEKKRRTKKVKVEVEEISTAPTAVELSHAAKETEPQRRKERNKDAAMSSTLDPLSELGECCGLCRKKHKRRKIKEEEVAVMDHTLEPVQTVESHEATSCREPLEKEERKRKKKMKMEEVPHAPLALDHLQIAKPPKKKRKKKEASTNGFVYGKFSAEEDAALKQAVFDYIREMGWEREDGIHKIIQSKSGEVHCWPIIGKCLPHRKTDGLYARAHKLLGVRFGKWTSAEVEALKELHRVHGNQWTKISEGIGRERSACCLKWHNSVKWSNSLNQKTGRWSQEERQKLCTLVLKFLQEKRQIAKTRLLTKNHKGTRDDINWVYIAEHMEGRSGVQCSNQWYILSKSMESSVELLNGDDQPLPEREKLVRGSRWEKLQHYHRHIFQKLNRISYEVPISSLLKSDAISTVIQEWQRASTRCYNGSMLESLHTELGLSFNGGSGGPLQQSKALTVGL